MKTEENNSLKGRRILLAVSGSIAAVKTPQLVSSLVKSGADVKCIVTPSAAKLVSPISLASLSRNRCFQDKDQWSSKEPKPLHIDLAEWAEIIVIAPLSATTLARWSQGIADGLLASVLLAFEKSFIAAAAMNTAMWQNKRTQNNWLEIKKDKRVIPLEPSEGLLACDRVGEGKMVSNELIELAISSALIQANKKYEVKRDWEGLQLLITAGPTIEALDPARFLSNKSTGYMGVLLAQAAHFRGAKVSLVHGPIKVPEGWLEGLHKYPIINGAEMQQVLKELQPGVDAIAMTAAVADLRKSNGGQNKKISKKSLLNSIAHDLEEVPDLLSELAKRKNPHQVLLGFAALTGSDEEIVELGISKKDCKHCDLLMANPVDRPDQGFGESNNGGFLIGPEKLIRPIPITSKLVLAHRLLDEILEISSEKLSIH